MQMMQAAKHKHKRKQQSAYHSEMDSSRQQSRQQLDAVFLKKRAAEIKKSLKAGHRKTLGDQNWPQQFQRSTVSKFHS
jgi:hypothetical protein